MKNEYPGNERRPTSPSPRHERLDLPDADQLRRMLDLANHLHACLPADRSAAALSGVAELVSADSAAAWNGPAEGLVCVGVIARTGEPPAPAAMLPAGAKLLIGRRPTLSPVVRLHSDAVARVHEIRSVCADDAGPSLLVVRRARRPFNARERSIVHLLHPQLEWALQPAAPDAPPPPTHAVVLELLLTGLTEQQIASRLKRSTGIVQSHVTDLCRRHKVADREQLVAKLGQTPKE